MIFVHWLLNFTFLFRIVDMTKGYDMKIYFDMDGVLADFDSMVPNSAKLNHPSESLTPELRAAKKRFWQNIEKNKNFWRDIPVITGTNQMLSTFQKYGELFVLSKAPGANKFIGGATYAEFVASEKRQWVLKHLGHFFDDAHIIICNVPKGAAMNPTQNDILVDDRPENIQEWESHGGRGILFTKSLTHKQMIQQITKQR